MNTNMAGEVARAGWIHNLHPLTKLAFAGFVLCAALLFPGLWLTYLFFVLILLPLAASAQVLRQFLRFVLLGTFPFALSLFLIQGFLWPDGMPVWTLGPLSLKAEGVTFAIKFTGRILLLSSGFLLLSLTTRPDRLMLALRQRGLPDPIAYIVLTTMQIIPRFQMKATTILDAQRARGLETEGSLILRIRALLPLIVPLVLGSIVDVEERAIALEGRAFSRSGPKTTLIDLPDSLLQRIVRWSLLATAAGILVVRLALPALN
jgi:energy-coupling factor transport system permease protein